jgi:hypothetical protein
MLQGFNNSEQTEQAELEIVHTREVLISNLGRDTAYSN